MGILIFTLMATLSGLHADSCPPPPMVSLSHTVIQNLIQNPECHIRSINDLLAHLPTELGQQPVYFFRSRSLQGPHQVDYLNPRAILFRTNTRYENRKLIDQTPFVLSFNGDTNEPGYLAVEMLEMHPETPEDAFRYFEISFPASDDEALKMDWAQVQSQMRYSGPNPSRCVACHGLPARPILPGYPVWEGAFGSEHHGRLPVEEVSGLAAFVHKVRGPLASRYKTLPDPDMMSADSSIESLVESRARNNFALNANLGGVNAIRVARLVQQTANYHAFRYATAAAFADCDNLTTFVPEPLLGSLLANLERTNSLGARWRTENIKAVYQRIFRATNDGSNIGNSLQKINGTAITFPELVRMIRSRMGSSAAFERLQIDTIMSQGLPRADFLGGNLRLLFEGRGIAIQNWFMDLTQPTYRYHDGADAGVKTATLLVEDDPTFDSAAKELFNLESSNAPKVKAAQCNRLKQLSLAALAGLKAGPIAKTKTGRLIEDGRYPAVFKTTCATCHDPRSGEPLCTPIPFGSPSKLARWMANPQHVAMVQERVLAVDEDQRMPPTRPLTDAELNSIVSYLGRH